LVQLRRVLQPDKGTSFPRIEPGQTEALCTISNQSKSYPASTVHRRGDVESDDHLTAGCADSAQEINVVVLGESDLSNFWVPLVLFLPGVLMLITWQFLHFGVVGETPRNTSAMDTSDFWVIAVRSRC